MEQMVNELEHFVRIAVKNDKTAIIHALADILAELDELNAKRNKANKFDKSEDRIRYHRVNLIRDTLMKGLRRIERIEMRKAANAVLVSRTRAITKEKAKMQSLVKPLTLAFNAGRSIERQQKPPSFQSASNVAQSAAFKKALEDMKKAEDEKMNEELSKSIFEDGNETQD